MKVWDLEKEYDLLLDFLVRKRETRRRDVGGAVSIIRDELLKNGEKALLGFCRKWDGWKKDYPLRVEEDEIDAAANSICKKDIDILKGMINNVTLYHKSQKLKPRTYKKRGIIVRDEFIPVQKAMVYVPGGTAPYPSSLVMGAVPAKIAGVREIYVATPARNGDVNPYILACCKLVGIADVYRIGGAQAIYAFSYGVGPIPKVDMIVGPGNAFVEEAKRDVYGRVGIDMLAGPTELIILCAAPFSPDAIAWDLFSQGEHDEMATVGLFSPSKDHIYDVMRSIERLLPENPRRAIIEKALNNNGFFVYYKNMDKAIEAVNTIAPEHMELIGGEDRSKAVLYPGIIYLGGLTPVAMGDYYIGTNHILPTGGAGRFVAGLSVDRFMRRKTTVRLEREFLDKHADKAVQISRIEGLHAHGEAIKARKELNNET